jgi:hypothetical protein
VTTATLPVTLEELVAMFVGVPVDTDNGDWSTTPTHSFLLAHEVARRTDPASEIALRRTFYGDLTPDRIGTSAVEAIRLGFDRYRITRGSRGL